MAPSLAAMATSLGLRLPGHAATHAMALDARRLAWATAGSLYPDHVIFLGPSAAALPADSMAAAVTVGTATNKPQAFCADANLHTQETSTTANCKLQDNPTPVTGDA